MSKGLIFNEKTIFKRNPNVQDIKTNEGIIISSPNLRDENIYYLDNSISCKIWSLIDGESPLDKIKQDLLSKYDVNDKTLEKDLKGFIKDLYLKKIILKAK